jgi:hypothetical protein
VGVLICFYCDNLYCGPAPDRVPRTLSFHSTPARARLVRLAKEAFPDDKEVQGLREQWAPGE